MKYLALLLLVPALLAGCATTSDLPPEDQAVMRYDSVSLDGRLALLEVNRADSGDLIRTQVLVHNRSAFALSYQYKFRWYDRNGFEIAPDGEPWQPRRLAGRSEERLQGVAPNPSAVRFEIWVRE
ncbi:YcfL family protein [Alcanivorax sp. JB21]|uniref:YcfL family protein n=1 Tax=Alcanivorax limicola TaxID=2874102 RepID=UPI001CBAF204|nr:YcfL family protein [Alcanivorax limicola]MBZ2189146.1 YcfL family protein [Alcanivorax limicola]